MKKIFYTILFTLTFFLGLNSVSADLNRMYMSFEGGVFEIGDSGYLTNNSKQFTNRITFTDESYDKDRNTTLYARYAVCSDSPIYADYIDVQDTNIKCRSSHGSSYGTLTFLTGAYNEQYLEVYTVTPDGPTTYTYNTSFLMHTFTGYGSGYFDLFGVDVGRTLSDFPTYTAESEILDELDNLHHNVIVQLDKLNDTNEEILYYVQKMYENMVTCHESYNLFDASLIPSSTGIQVNNDGSIITMPISNSNGYVDTTKRLKELAPKLKVGDTVTLNFYRSLPGNFRTNKIYLTTAQYEWKNGSTVVITDQMLNSYVILYGNNLSNNLETEQIVLSDFQMVLGTSSKPFEPYGQEICKSKTDETNAAINESNKKLDETNNKLQQQQDFMNDDDTSGSSSEAQEFFEGFDTDTYGLTSIITAPLELIGNLAGSTCSPLPLEIPFVGGTFNLPCMSSIYKKHFGSFLTVYQTITFGIVAYWVCVRIFALVKDFKNPEHDEIEVMDL